MNTLRKKISRILFEFVETPKTFLDVEGLKNFLESEMLLGMEDDVQSILEGQPNDSVRNAIAATAKFREADREIEAMSQEEILNMYMDSANVSQAYTPLLLQFLRPVGVA